VSSVETPAQMLERAQAKIADGVDPQRLIDVAIAHRDDWAALVERQEAGELLDGRASIYSGETYAQARDRWEAYLELLVADAANVVHGSLS
jgi:hypothetical protein